MSKKTKKDSGTDLLAEVKALRQQVEELKREVAMLPRYYPYSYPQPYPVPYPVPVAPWNPAPRLPWIGENTWDGVGVTSTGVCLS